MKTCLRAKSVGCLLMLSRVWVVTLTLPQLPSLPRLWILCVRQLRWPEFSRLTGFWKTTLRLSQFIFLSAWPSFPFSLTMWLTKGEKKVRKLGAALWEDGVDRSKDGWHISTSAHEAKYLRNKHFNLFWASLHSCVRFSSRPYIRQSNHQQASTVNHDAWPHFY